MMQKLRFLILLLCLTLNGCSTVDVRNDHLSELDQAAMEKKWRGLPVNAGELALLAYVPEQKNDSETLFVYMEDDVVQPGRQGLPVLEIAMMQPTMNAAYLGRPCQNVLQEEAGCRTSLWEDERFSPMAIWATVEALDQLKQHFSASRIVLIGFDGSGVMAALVAARRKDIAAVVLVSSVPDTSYWAKLHGVPLVNPLNPAGETDKLADVRQYYVIGAPDPLAPARDIQKYAQRFPEDKQPVILSDGVFSRKCCWDQTWPAIWQKLDESVQAIPVVQ